MSFALVLHSRGGVVLFEIGEEFGGEAFRLPPIGILPFAIFEVRNSTEVRSIQSHIGNQFSRE